MCCKSNISLFDFLINGATNKHSFNKILIDLHVDIISPLLLNASLLLVLMTDCSD